MILSWNVRGLNKAAKQKEINSRLLKLQPSIAILLETRIKRDKADRCRRNMGNRWQFIDNYSKHDNGRIWVLWDENNTTIKMESMTDQMVHCGVYNTDGGFVHWLTAIYASNNLDRRKELWRDMGNISKSQQGPWIAMGDFNNVLGMQDRIGGRAVQELEFRDLRDMMENEGLFEIESIGERFTWYNKHTKDPIYSCIDRVIGNMEWIQKNMNKTVHMLEPGVSDHAVVCIQGDVLEKPKTGFKFINAVTGMIGYNEEVARSWQEQSRGDKGNRLWQKLMRLQLVLKKLNRPILSIKSQLEEKRNELNEVQNKVRQDKMNKELISKERICTEELLKLSDLEEEVLRQRAKVDWIRKGDGNNSFFHSTIRSRAKQKMITKLVKDNGEICVNKEDMETEVLEFYTSLMGTAAANLEGVDIGAMRRGKQLNREKRAMLSSPVQVSEIEAALKSIGDLKAP
ncbi:uncharacterized protein LOC131596982 [Vicia villosa]|uniref:uncharacterized protein LOC131596982 n=1 Tax=Vicia villosa TaxID=3911 RepID=UPI00273AF2F8|nr:uncharacterized protein LOC131596982 [Vicia villosa]